MRKLLNFLEAKARLAAKSQAVRRRAATPAAREARTPPPSSAHHGVLENMPAGHLEALLKSCYEVGKVADCSPDFIKPRLIKTVRMFGYEVREAESVVSASRGGRTGAAGDTSASLFDHPTSLRVELQPLGTNQTLLTFSYIVKRATELTLPDKQTLELEASLILTQANSHVEVKSCLRCGAALHFNSLFCGRCGVSLAAYENVEAPGAKYLHVIAHVRAGRRAISGGVAVLLLSLAASLLCIYRNISSLRFALALTAAGAGLGLCGVLRGLWRLRRALQP